MGGADISLFPVCGMYSRKNRPGQLLRRQGKNRKGLCRLRQVSKHRPEFLQKLEAVRDLPRQPLYCCIVCIPWLKNSEVALPQKIGQGQESHPTVLQPWYADDAAMQGLPQEVADCFKLLKKLGPMFGYLPEPAKSFAICPLATEELARSIFEEADLSVRFCRGHR